MKTNEGKKLQESSLFAKEMADVSPIRQVDKVHLKANKEETPGQQYRRQMACFSKDEQACLLSLILKKTIPADQWLSFKREGIQTGVFKKLRTGRYQLEATLNLNKKTPAQARDELLQFVKDCQDSHIRSILIFYGHGKTGDLLKSYLSQWMPELKEVQAFHTAQKFHGGSAAIYVLLRKSEQKRMENRERHAARLGEAL